MAMTLEERVQAAEWKVLGMLLTKGQPPSQLPKGIFQQPDVIKITDAMQRVADRGERITPEVLAAELGVKPGLDWHPRDLLECDPGEDGVRTYNLDLLLEAARHRTRFRLLSASQIEELPPPQPLVGDKLTRSGLTVLVGPPGSGKTFLAMGWALSVSEGVPWCGEAVHRGPVVYVAAEGSAGLGVRVRAWKAANMITGPLGVHFITEPVSLLNAAEVGHLLQALHLLPEPPALVVLDTLARCMIGGDENSTQDMSAFIAGADRIRTETGAAVLILHHMNAGGERERGNTALRGACDTMMFVKAEGDFLTLTCEKQKDAAPFAKTALRLVPFGESCAVVAADRAPQSAGQELTEKQTEILNLLRTHFLEEGATASEWLKVSGFPERTFYEARSVLWKKGYVNKPEQPRGGRYTLTPEGESFLTANCGLTADFLRRSDPKLLRAEGGALESPPHRSNGRAGVVIL